MNELTSGGNESSLCKKATLSSRVVDETEKRTTQFPLVSTKALARSNFILKSHASSLTRCISG